MFAWFGFVLEGKMPRLKCSPNLRRNQPSSHHHQHLRSTAGLGEILSSRRGDDRQLSCMDKSLEKTLNIIYKGVTSTQGLRVPLSITSAVVRSVLPFLLTPGWSSQYQLRTFWTCRQLSSSCHVLKRTRPKPLLLLFFSFFLNFFFIFSPFKMWDFSPSPPP